MWPFERTNIKNYSLEIIPKPTITPFQVANSILAIVQIEQYCRWKGVDDKVIKRAKELDGYLIDVREI